MKRFWSDRIRDLVPYTPGEQPRDRILIKLNTNENPYPPSPRALEAARNALDDRLRLYPDPECAALREAIARRYGLESAQVFVGNGSDEVLAFCFQALFATDKPVLFPDVTYSFYPVYAGMFGLSCETVPLNDDFTVPVEKLRGNGGGVVVANPNAPTGAALPLDDIRRILDQNPDSAVVVDEAYVDFGAQSAASLIGEYPNLVVVQTFSKSRSLAGMRVGFALGSADLIAGINCVKNSVNSYTVDRVAMAAAQAAMEDEAYFDETRRKIMATRERTAGLLRELGFSVCPSQANFLFVTHPAVPAERLLSDLRERGILVRHFRAPRTANHLRITVGTDEEMDALLRALKELTAQA